VKIRQSLLTLEEKLPRFSLVVKLIERNVCW